MAVTVCSVFVFATVLYDGAISGLHDITWFG